MELAALTFFSESCYVSDVWKFQVKQLERMHETMHKTFNKTMLRSLWRIFFFMITLFSKFMHRLLDKQWLYINCFQSPWFQCIIIESRIFSWWVSRGESMFLKRERISRKKDEKRKTAIHISALWSVLHKSISKAGLSSLMAR